MHNPKIIANLHATSHIQNRCRKLKKIVQELKRKINRLKKEKTFNVYPPENLSTIDEFEEFYDIELPKFYKYFITNIANGIEITEKGKSEFYVPNDIISKHNFSKKEKDNELNREFPLINEKMEFSASKHDYFDIYNGTIYLKGRGCGNEELFIVKGKSKGQIWINEIPSNDEIFPDYRFNLEKNNFKNWITNSVNFQTRRLNTNKLNLFKLIKFLIIASLLIFTLIKIFKL